MVECRLLHELLLTKRKNVANEYVDLITELTKTFNFKCWHNKKECILTINLIPKIASDGNKEEEQYEEI